MRTADPDFTFRHVTCLLALALLGGCRAGGRQAIAREAPPPAPRGAHPRIVLTPQVLATLKQKAKDDDSATAAVIASCRKAAPAKGQGDGYQGSNWAFPASACALAYQLTGDKSFAAKGVKFWRALLDDVSEMGDRKGCVAGASPEQAITAVRRDTGYAIRFIGPHAALTYDWLHDAPGVDEPLRKQSRACFAAWIDWYTKDGYLRTQPGANYHAGYVFAKTMVAIALGGEAGPTGDRYWKETVDDVFGAQLVDDGLTPKTGPGRVGGVLLGGDWPEGWQYGQLSVIEYALSARALEQHGVRLPALRAWADELPIRFLHGLLPARDGMFVGGDTEAEGPYLPVGKGALVAAMLGPGSDRPAAWAAALAKALPAGRADEINVLDALAEARVVAPADPLATPRPLWTLAQGTRTVYARSAWTPAAHWAVFSSPPRQVPDHQHVDATSFVFSRGGDHLVVDPTTYGSRSSLEANAVTVDSDVVQGKYKPSQTPWSRADLPWARGTRSGVVAARGDIARAFDFNGKESDVPLARRDWVFLPEGEIVTIDRARTGGPRRAMYLRFRSPGTLGFAAGGIVRADVGGSSLAIRTVSISPAASPAVKAIARATDCPGPHGACAIARFPVSEYSIATRGAEVLAVHVLDGLAKGEAPARALRLDDPAVDAKPPQNAAVVGAAVSRGAAWTYVVAAAATADEPPGALSYGVPGAASSRHVVFDAPEDGEGRAAVTASAAGGRCLVKLSSSGDRKLKGRPVVFNLGPAASGCAVGEDADVPPDSPAFPPAR
jgi:hypothetical protein